MPRPPRCRRIVAHHKLILCPNGCENTEPILLTLDEYEAIRLVDLEQQTHEQCAAQMDISRSTVQEIYESARRKIAACLVHGKPLHITGGKTTASAEDRRQPTAAAAAGCREATRKKFNKKMQRRIHYEKLQSPMKTVKFFSISATPNSSRFMKLRTAKSLMRKSLTPTAVVTAHWQVS